MVNNVNTESLGKYQLIEIIGKGGFATVYKAVDTTLEREVALKVLDPLLMRDATWVDRFRREARAVAALKHAHIVTIYEIGEVQDRIFIAMELAQEGSLANMIVEQGCLSWGDTLAMLEPVCDALDYAHAQGIVHRDLKPANILIDPDGGALLTDFGFARLLGDNSMSLSMSGGIVGTPAYVAPEIWELDVAQVPADIYALGCIVYEMLTGQVLFYGATPMQSMRAHDKGPQFPDTWPQGVPQGIARVLQKALDREADARYGSAQALWHALNDLTAQAEAAEQAAQLAAVAAQWREETMNAINTEGWSVAKMAVARWLKAAPGNEDALAAQAKIELKGSEGNANTSRHEPVQVVKQSSTPKPDPFHQVHTSNHKASTKYAGLFAAILVIVICGIIGVLVVANQYWKGRTAASEPTYIAPTWTKIPSTTASVITATPLPTSTSKPTSTRTSRPTSTPRPSPTPVWAFLDDVFLKSSEVFPGEYKVIDSYEDDGSCCIDADLYIHCLSCSKPDYRVTYDYEYGNEGHTSWSPNGRMFSGTNMVGEWPDKHNELMVWMADGSWKTVLKDDLELWSWSTSWSPDGREITYVNGDHIETYNVLTDDVRILVPASAIKFQSIISNQDVVPTISRISWSPDGAKLIYTYDRWNHLSGWQDETSYEIWIVSADGSDYFRLRDIGEDTPMREPYWTTDGHHILFRDRDYTPWIMDTDGENRTPLTRCVVIRDEKYFPKEREFCP